MKGFGRVRLISAQCYACGIETEDTEEFPRYGSTGCVVTCCGECRRLARDKFEDSILDRASFIQDKLKTKYKQHIASPAWSEEEINEMTGYFPGDIRRFAAISARARERTSWNYERHLRQIDVANDPHEIAAFLGIDTEDPPPWWRGLFPGY